MRAPRRQRGLVLLALLVILTLGSLYLFLGNLSPAIAEAQRARRTEAALAEAREALLGYAMRYRDLQIATGTNNAMYGYVPLPDLGTLRNQNIGCDAEGCAIAANYTGADPDPVTGRPQTLAGRFPWRTLGTPPLRDGHGECLWLIVSSSHGALQSPGTPPAMNWDAVGHLEVVTATGAATLRNALAVANRSLHQRPLAIIVAPGPVMAGQDRSTGAAPPAGDDVTECGGNYDAANYFEWLAATIDDGTAAERAANANPFAGSTNNSGAQTTPDPANAIVTQRDKSYPVHVSGAIGSAGGVLVPQSCPGCATNDSGAVLTPDHLFSRMRGGQSFRADINSMLERMTECLRDQVAAGGGFVPAAINGFAVPGDKSAGRVPANACYDDTQAPLGYFSQWQEMFFVAKPNVGNFTINGTICTGGALLFANQRGAGQVRYYDYINGIDRRDLPANYLEGDNLTNFTGVGTTFSGQQALARVSATQSASQDIVRCIPGSASLEPVVNPALTSAQQLATYNPATRTLTLGREGIESDLGFPAAALFGCAWQPAARELGEGLRSYFRFSFDDPSGLSGSVGNTGFVFAMIDGESNTGSPCGAAGSMLGYGGNNTFTPLIAPPKLGIEFDQSRNSGYTESSATFSFGRRDPCGSFFCGGTYGYDTHAAILYWGHESANATDGVIDPLKDDNVHGHPSSGSLVSVRKPPTSPSDIAAAAPGIAMINMRTGGDVFHVRLEVTPARIAASPAEHSKTTIVTKAWVLKDSATDAAQIAAMKNTTRPMSQLYASFQPTLSDTADVFDVPGSACGGGCASGQACGSDNVCYRPALRNVRLGFTNSQRTQDQQITITDLFTTWLQ